MMSFIGSVPCDRPSLADHKEQSRFPGQARFSAADGIDCRLGLSLGIGVMVPVERAA
ncbi:MAG TPA: hypothetical protein VIU82_05865 [Bosea sp. (in: a-proteobacteria)]